MTVLEGRLIGEEDWIRIEELCSRCDLSVDVMTELLELEVVVRRAGRAPTDWEVMVADVPRLRCAIRLITDLGVNVTGAALALELLESRRLLERRVRELERLIGLQEEI
jgi:chaperone modulatory protein CbpM